MSTQLSGTEAGSRALGLANGRYEAVIGLEVHCQLKTASKLFCACPSTFGAEPNAHTCPVCLGHPGSLPVINKLAVDDAIKLALAVGATLHPTSVFARKQYFYPDLPKGYQISQYDLPYCTGGGIQLADGTFVRLTRIHMEEDAGKNVHAGSASFVDLNRAGTPLLEIVTEPMIHTAAAAADYLRQLHTLVRYLDISDGNMEEGSFRCDANVSLRLAGSHKLGTRTEIKNVNSFRNVERAINYEIMRQADVLDAGEAVRQQTMLFDAATGKTSAMRSKEESQDYRYFPDPDLGPLFLAPERIASIQQSLPELPAAKEKRFLEDFQLSKEDTALLIAERELASYFEATVTELAGAVSPKIVANWVISEFLRLKHEKAWAWDQVTLTSTHLAGLLRLLGDGTISGKIAKAVFDEMAESGHDAQAIVSAKGLVQVSDQSAIQAVVQQVVDANPAQVAQFLSGKDKVYGFFVGQIMKASQGKFNPDVLNRLLREALEAKRGQ